MLPMRECHNGLPLAASNATKLPPASPVNTRSPAVASTPPDPPAPVTPGNSCRHSALPVA